MTTPTPEAIGAVALASTEAESSKRAPTHFVKIVDGKIKFECQDTAANCHWYPACDCESFNKDHSAEYGQGHEMIDHAQCWMQDWFNNGGAVYVGDDREHGADLGVPANMNRAGFVTTWWEDEWVEFEFTVAG